LFLPPPYKNNGFTLAEVLITLVIIGVIAAITVPTMMNSKRNEELRAGLLKAQSTLAGALEMYYVKNGVRIVSSDASETASFKGKIIPYISTARNCGLGHNDSAACVVTNDDSGNVDLYKTYNNKNVFENTYLDDGQFVMNDGMAVFIENFQNRLYIFVDVNGFNKKPNKAGQDLFAFQLNAKGNLVPMGAKGTAFYSDTNEYCSETSSAKLNGIGCTAKALADPNWFKNLH